MKEIKKKNWYVFYTSPRAEKKVNEYLLSLGYESFLPLKSEFKIWRNRQRKLIKSPLFPSYIFVLATRNDIFDINRIFSPLLSRPLKASPTARLSKATN